MREVPVLDGEREDHRREDAGAAAVELRAEAVRHEYANGGKECREQARGEVRHAEELERRDELPVKQDGLIVPVIPEDARRQVISRRDHLLGRLHIIRLHRSVTGISQLPNKNSTSAKAPRYSRSLRSIVFLPTRTSSYDFRLS